MRLATQCCTTLWLAIAGCGLNKPNPIYGLSESGSASAGSSGGSGTTTITTSSGPETSSGTMTGGAFPDDPLLWYRFNDQVANTIVDDGSAGLDAMCSLCITYGTGVEGTAGVFDDGGNVRLADSREIRLGALSIAAWVQTDGPPAGGTSHVLAKPFGNEIANSYELWLASYDTDQTATVRFAVESGNGFFEVFAPFPGNGWHHLAGTFDGADLRLYVDGELRDSHPAYPPDYDINSLHLGHDFDYGSEASWLRGSIDDLRVYDRALSPGEVAALAVGP